jgi:TolB-like protein
LSFFEELKRRNVFRVGMAYAISAWVLLQFVDIVLENIQAPDWIMKVFMLALACGFPIAVFFAWAFEMTPEGIKKEKDVDRTQSITSTTGRKLDRTIIVVLLIAVVYFAWDNFSPAPSGSSTGSDKPQQAATAEHVPKSIAVLPFADLSQAKDQEWFADGLAEEILNALAKTPDLLVSSRTSSFRYKASTLDLPDIANELGVAHILEGSVRSSGDRIRVTAQLIRASDGFHVWSENYDRDVADMIEIQEDLALNIAKALKTTMDPVALAAMMNAGTRSVEAYEAYLHGLAATSLGLLSSDSESFLASYQDFELARSIDSNFAAAHMRAADFWKVQLTPNRIDSGLTEIEPRQMMVEFNHRIDQAIATAKTALGKKEYMAYKATVELRLREAISLYQEYLRERPNDNLARYNLITLAAWVSDEELKRELLAYWRERGGTDQNITFAYMNDAYSVIDPSKAADFGLNALQRWPNNTNIIYQTHRTLLWAGRFLEAKALADRFDRLSPQANVFIQARQACAEGRRTDAEAIYNSIDPNDINRRSDRWHILMLLGKEREAAEILRLYTDSSIPFQIAGLLSYPQFDPTPFPMVMAVLEREGINRPPAVEIPFKCPPPELTSG